MALIQNWLPPSRENWQLLCYIFQTFPLFAFLQFLTPWYPMGKTSIESRLNIPGKWAWLTMEVPGSLSLLYTVKTLSEEVGMRELPWGNKLMIAMFIIHYVHRAVLAPLFLNPSMSPIHVSVWLAAVSFQLFNGISIGAWLGGYGPTTDAYWNDKYLTIGIGSTVWALGMFGNWYHDEVLRDIRREATRKQRAVTKDGKKDGGKTGGGSDRVYLIPEAGLFKLILYPHYLCEWIEWVGFWIVGGWACVPAQNFVVNEVASMLPRTINGWNWYVKRFGREQVGKRMAVIPGIL